MSTTIYEIQAEFCQAMAHPLRLEIIHNLRGGPKTVNEIAQMIHCDQSNVSRHLALLRSRGILAAHRQKQGVLYNIANPKLAQICDLVRQVLAELAAQQAEMAKTMEARLP
jgi:ArsR family transcriptional regulator